MVEKLTDASLNEQNPTREKQLLDTIQEIEVPFMQALQREYGADRGWRMCGPAAVALTRVISTLTGIPIQKNGAGEHLEIELGIFDPENAPDRLSRIEEQTYVRYYTGTGQVYYIDPIYGLLMGNRSDIKGAIQVEKYEEADIDNQLATKHNLHRFDPLSERVSHVPLFAKMSPETRLMFYSDTISAIHDERATLPMFVGDSGALYHSDNSKAEAVIRSIAPEWRIDRETEIRLLRQAVHARYGNPPKNINYMRNIEPELKIIKELNINKEYKATFIP